MSEQKLGEGLHSLEPPAPFPFPSLLPCRCPLCGHEWRQAMKAGDEQETKVDCPECEWGEGLETLATEYVANHPSKEGVERIHRALHIQPQREREASLPGYHRLPRSVHVSPMDICPEDMMTVEEAVLRLGILLLAVVGAVTILDTIWHQVRKVMGT